MARELWFEFCRKSIQRLHNYYWLFITAWREKNGGLENSHGNVCILSGEGNFGIEEYCAYLYTQNSNFVWIWRLVCQVLFLFLFFFFSNFDYSLFSFIILLLDCLAHRWKTYTVDGWIASQVTNNVVVYFAWASCSPLLQYSEKLHKVMLLLTLHTKMYKYMCNTFVYVCLKTDLLQTPVSIFVIFSFQQVLNKIYQNVLTHFHYF